MEESRTSYRDSTKILRASLPLPPLPHPSKAINNDRYLILFLFLTACSFFRFLTFTPFVQFLEVAATILNRAEKQRSSKDQNTLSFHLLTNETRS